MPLRTHWDIKVSFMVVDYDGGNGRVQAIYPWSEYERREKGGKLQDPRFHRFYYKINVIPKWRNHRLA